MTLFVILACAFLIYVLQNIIYEKYWSRNLSIKVDFSKKQAYKGDTVSLVEVLTNSKALPLLMVRLKFIVDRGLKFMDVTESISVSDKCYKNDIFSLLFYQKITRTIPVVCEKRGFYTITEMDVSSSNLFLNINYVTHMPVYTELTVFPAVVSTERLSILYRKIMGDVVTRHCLYEDPFEFRGIREYAPTDPQNLINWKASARTGELKVNMHECTNSREICILLNLERETNWEADYLIEECISIAAGLCMRLIEDGITVRLICNGCDIITGLPLRMEGGLSVGHMESVLTGLARIDLSLPMSAFTEVINGLLNESGDNTMYVMVSVACGGVLQESYERLCTEKKNGIWILPYSYKPEFDIKLCPSADVIAWEVTANEQ